MQLNQETRAFIERTGLAMERLNLTRTFGRLFGLLLVADRPVSLDDVVQVLRVSKASASTNARLCEQVGLTHQVSIPGDRRDYYEMLPGSFERVLAARLSTVHEMVRLAQEGLEAVDPDNVSAQTRLEEMREFYDFAAYKMNDMLTQWKRGERRRQPRKVLKE
jgi:DNA-binding transcriptional regulator GbsR (MarR family)